TDGKKGRKEHLWTEINIKKCVKNTYIDGGPVKFTCGTLYPILVSSILHFLTMLIGAMLFDKCSPTGTKVIEAIIIRGKVV
ncbi:hypothetical protein, partial [Staphylococcus aureus]